MNRLISKLFFLLLFVVCACSLKKNVSIENYNLINCPSDGKCSIEVINNKSLVVSFNEDNTISYTLNDDFNHSVIRFHFKKNMDQIEHDGAYSELLVFEISNIDGSNALKDEALQTTNMLFGRFCFCRGQVGLYKIKEGTLEWTKKGKDLQFNLNFQCNDVPQVVKNIKVINGKL